MVLDDRQKARIKQHIFLLDMDGWSMFQWDSKSPEQRVQEHTRFFTWLSERYGVIRWVRVVSDDNMVAGYRYYLGDEDESGIVVSF